MSSWTSPLNGLVIDVALIAATISLKDTLPSIVRLRLAWTTSPQMKA